MPFNFAPIGWALCNGQLIAIAQNTALFSLLGTQFGGDGRSTFGLPNLQGNAPMNQGNGAGLTPRTMGETGGEPSVTLTISEIPAHPHTAMCASASTTGTPGPTIVFGGGGRGKEPAYAPASQPNAALMNPLAVAMTGSSQPHNNLPPYLTLNFIIALQGIFPPRS
ncbi:phage tail protein [Paracidobacterium acidisoli]|uniref:phage tail protein n=1 Tax=Paracidobacterium acidisoli TaxID=2303751 RepID=UPI003D9DD76F